MFFASYKYIGYGKNAYYIKRQHIGDFRLDEVTKYE